MRDRRAVWGFFFSAFTIQVNPLAVAGGFSKRGDAFLGYDEPIACCEFAANGTMQRFDGGNLVGRIRTRRQA